MLLLLSITTIAQPRFKEKKEQIKALKIAYITDELQLTSDEALRFWPLFNAFESKQRELRKEKVSSFLDRLEGGQIEKLSEKEATNLLNQMESNEEELFQVRKKFMANLKGILSPMKIIKLKRAEEGFNRKLLKQYRDKGMKE